MFGLFSKKDKKEKSQEVKQEKVQVKKVSKGENPEFLKLVEKWDAFLEKMETRFTESLVNAEEAVLDNLDESNYDLTPTLRIWSGIKTQLQGLSTKIDETFDENVKPQMQVYKEDWDLLNEGQKGVVISESIYERIERFEIILEGKASKKFYDHAITFLSEDFLCSQCSAKLEISKDIFRSHYVSCEYCNTANTFTPNDKIVQIRWVADSIAKHSVIDKWDIMKKAQHDFHKIRPPGEDQNKTEYEAGFKNRENTELEFWKSYFTERANIITQYQETIEHDTAVKMKWFYEERKRELNY